MATVFPTAVTPDLLCVHDFCMLKKILAWFAPFYVVTINNSPLITVLELGRALLGCTTHCTSLGCPQAQAVLPGNSSSLSRALRSVSLMSVFPGALFKGKPQGFGWFWCHQEEIEPLSILHGFTLLQKKQEAVQMGRLVAVFAALQADGLPQFCGYFHLQLNSLFSGFFAA